MSMAAWLALAPLRLLAALGLRRSLILACLFVLTVTAYGVAEDLGLLDPPAAAKPVGWPGRRPERGRPRRHPLWLPHPLPARRPALSGAVLERCWPPSGRSSPTTAAAASPGSAPAGTPLGRRGRCSSASGSGRAGNAWARYGADFDRDGRANVYDPGDAIPAAARYLCAAGAPRRLDRALYAYNHSWAYVAKVKAIAARYRSPGGDRQ